MDILSDKKKRTDYEALSRYQTIPYYYHKEDNKFVYGVTSHLVVDGVEYVAHTLKNEDTLESLALKYYGRPDYYWILADFNRITDPFIKLKDRMSIIKVPSLGQLVFED